MSGFILWTDRLTLVADRSILLTSPEGSGLTLAAEMISKLTCREGFSGPFTASNGMAP